MAVGQVNIGKGDRAAVGQAAKGNEHLGQLAGDVGSGDHRRVVGTGNLHSGGGPTESAVAQANRVGKGVVAGFAQRQGLKRRTEGRRPRVVCHLAARSDGDGGTVLAVINDVETVWRQQIGR